MFGPENIKQKAVSVLLCHSGQPEPVNYWDEETAGIRNKIEDGWRWNRAKSMNFGFAGKLGKERAGCLPHHGEDGGTQNC